MKFKRGLSLYVVQILALYAVNAELAEAESVSSNLLMPRLCKKLNSNFLFKSCAAQKALDKECESYTHSIVKPLLDSVKQLTDEASQIESKDRTIKELSEKVAALQAYKDRDESYAVLFRDLQV